MRKLLVSAAAVLVAVLWPAGARAECTLFSIDAKCSKSAKAMPGVTFGATSKPVTPAVKAKPEQRTALLPHPPDTAAIDCRMVHQPDRTTGLSARVLTPHPGVTHSMRNVIVPACEK